MDKEIKRKLDYLVFQRNQALKGMAKKHDLPLTQLDRNDIIEYLIAKAYEKEFERENEKGNNA